MFIPSNRAVRGVRGKAMALIKVLLARTIAKD